jgi:hypothetical protein
MSEAEIMVQVSLNDEALWVMIQWWVSISFGLIALAHFGRNQLTLPLVILLALIYIAGTGVYWTVIQIYVQSSLDYFGDLRSLRDAGALTQGTETYIRRWTDPWHVGFFGIAMIGIFFGTIWYFFYRYRGARRS